VTFPAFYDSREGVRNRAPSSSGTSEIRRSLIDTVFKEGHFSALRPSWRTSRWTIGTGGRVPSISIVGSRRTVVYRVDNKNTTARPTCPNETFNPRHSLGRPVPIP